MSWGAVIAGAASLVGGYLSSNAAGEASDAAGNAAGISNAEAARQFDITQQNMQPWLQAGGWALGQQQAFLNGNWSGFKNSPDYLWAVDQGSAGLDRGATANGNLWGGGADADRIALGQGLATQYAGNYFNRLAGLSGTGQQTAGQLGQFGQQYANQVGQNAWGLAGVQGQSAYNQSDAWNNALQGAVGAYGYWQQNRRGSSTGQGPNGS